MFCSATDVKGNRSRLARYTTASWRRHRASPAGGCKTPCSIPAGSSRSCSKQEWVDVQEQASGLGRGAAQWPWFSPGRGEKKKPRSFWPIGFSMQPSRHRRSEPGRPGRKCISGMHASRAKDFHQCWHRPLHSLERIASILFLEHFQRKPHPFPPLNKHI